MAKVTGFKAGWKIDANDEACYIDIDLEDEPFEDSENETPSNWGDLPDLLLEEIFYYLNMRERYYCSMLCKNWYRAFFLPNVWKNFLVEDQTLTRPLFNYYSGYQYILNHMRTQNCLGKVGKLMRGIEFRPEHNFNNMYQFMTLLTYFITQGKITNCSSEYVDVGNRLRSLKYTFPCNMASRDDPESIKLFGTGGQLLKTLKDLMLQLTQLTSLKLVDLMLERYEAKHLLDEVLESCSMVLKKLYLVNVTILHCPIMHVGLFFNLESLYISPQNVDDDILQMLGSCSNLTNLYLLQNRYTPSSISISPCSPKGWNLLKKDNPSLRVHLRVENLTNGEILLQPEAPVYSLTYQTPKTQITSEKILSFVDNYRYTLTVFGYELLPKFTSMKSFHSRVDSLLLLMVRSCPNLGVLMIREKVSTSTLLLLAKAGINLRYFYVRKNAVIIKCDWPRNPEWSDEFYEWLRESSKSYDSTELEISQIFGYKWSMLSDKQFKNKHIHVNCSL